MTRYLISFDEGAMTFAPEELPAVAAAAQAVVAEAKAAGAWIFGAGLTDSAEVSVVATTGAVTYGPVAGKRHHLGGFSIIEVATRDDALEWAAKFADACRCAQEVRELLYDPRS